MTKKCLLPRQARQKQGAVFLQPAVPAPVFREDPQDFGIKARRMIHLEAVAELMHDDAVQHLGRREHQEAVEIQISFCRAAAPAGLLSPYADASEVDPTSGA